MSLGNFQKFELVKIALSNGETVPDLQVQLDALAICYAEISDEFRLLDDDEQRARECEYLQLQYQYHEIAMVMLTKLLDPLFITEPDMDIEPTVEQTVDDPKSAESSEHLSNQSSPDLEQQSPNNNDAMELVHSDEGAQSLALQNVTANERANLNWSEIVSAEPEQKKSPPFSVYSKIMEPLFSLKPIGQVTERALDGILTVIANAGTMANNLGYTIEHDSAIIISCVQRNLDTTSQGIWLWQLNDREPTLNEFVEFLAQLTKRIPAITSQAQFPSTSRAAVGRADSNASRSSANGQEKSAKKAKVVCPRCEGSHLLHRCEQFRTLTLSAKVETVRRAKVCANCFAPSHYTGDCIVGACKRCGAKHNSLLCPRAQNNM